MNPLFASSRRWKLLMFAILLVMSSIFGLLLFQKIDQNQTLSVQLDNRNRIKNVLLQRLLENKPTISFMADSRVVCCDSIPIDINVRSGFELDRGQAVEGLVFHDGAELSRFTCAPIQESVVGGVTLAEYRCWWKPPSLGQYEIWIGMGSQRVSLRPTSSEQAPDSISVLGVQIDHKDIRAALDPMDRYFSKHSLSRPVEHFISYGNERNPERILIDVISR